MLCLSEPETINIAVRQLKIRSEIIQIHWVLALPRQTGSQCAILSVVKISIPKSNHKGCGDPSLSDLWFRFATVLPWRSMRNFLTDECWLMVMPIVFVYPKGLQNSAQTWVFNPRLLLRVPFTMQVIKDADSIHFTNNCWIGGPIHSTVCLSMIMTRATT